MPNFDQTGPQSMGPMTGRGFGFCGFGLRRGWRYTPRYRRFSAKEEKEALEEEVNILEEELKEMKVRIADLEN